VYAKEIDINRKLAVACLTIAYSALYHRVIPLTLTMNLKYYLKEPDTDGGGGGRSFQKKKLITDFAFSAKQKDVMITYNSPVTELLPTIGRN